MDTELFKSGSELVAENEGWKAYRITSHESCRFYGSNTKWYFASEDPEGWNWSVDQSKYFFISKTFDADNPLAKIAMIINKKGDITYWDASDAFKGKRRLPEGLDIPSFSCEEPDLWKPDLEKNIDVSSLGLTSLEGAPKKVFGHFSCIINQLNSLEGGPLEVAGNFSCWLNNLGSLKGAPQIVGGDFLCAMTNLTSLEGAPREVGGNFNCQGNPGNFTEAEVRAVCAVKGEVLIGSGL